MERSQKSTKFTSGTVWVWIGFRKSGGCF